jgi:Flp pilus assembly protein TadD
VCQALLADYPGHAQSRHLLGLLALGAGRFAEAHQHMARALPALIGSAELHRHLGLCLQLLGRNEEAIAAYRHSLKLQPDAGAFYNLGMVLHQSGRLDEALAAFGQAIELRPDYAEAHNARGIALRHAGRHNDAMTAYRRAAVLRPGFAEPHLNAGIALQEDGHTAEALAAMRRALAANPAHAHAWYQLSGLKTFVPNDPDIASLLALQNQPERHANDRSELAFALAKAMMDIGDTDAAFASLDHANRLKRSSFVYDVADDVAEMARFAQVFGPDIMQRFAGAGAASDVPIFILGMPRSGTTLIEQILASHPDVEGGGERPILQNVILDSLLHGAAPVSDNPRFGGVLREMGQAYLSEVARTGRGKSRITDKSMGNFRFAGPIHLMLPGARMIHCRRDPVDTCFSCFTKSFVSGLRFTYDLVELGAYYRAYDALMAHWRAVLPAECFLEISYESLVANLEGETRRLVAFCGLPWDGACLDFHRTRRVVQTASVNQVRQPIHAKSINRWQPYANHLAPLLAELQK